jgi:hypothetical protein
MMKYLVWYDTTTGLVEQTSYTSTDPAILFKKEGQEIIEVASPIEWSTSRVVGTAPNLSIVTIPAQPSPIHTWDNNANGGSGGWVGVTVPPEILFQEKVQSVSAAIAIKLQATNQYMISDMPVAIRNVYESYRNEVKEVISQSGYPSAIVWPEPPTFELVGVSSTVDEGTSFTVTLNAPRLLDGDQIDFIIAGTGITTSDIGSSRINGGVIPVSLDGSFIAQSGQSTLQLSLSNDVTREGSEAIRIYLPDLPQVPPVIIGINDTSV